MEPQEGDIVFVERVNLPRKMEHPAARLGHGTNSYAFARTVEQVNAQLAEGKAERASPYTYETFPWRLDGVINNTDSADPENEFKDFALANVAIQGFVRFSTLPFGDETRGHNFPHLFTQKGARNGDRVFLALVSRPAVGAADKKEYAFQFFLASHVTLGKTNPNEIEKVWRIGRVVDGNQSKNMVTLCVDVEPVTAEGVTNAWSRE